MSISLSEKPNFRSSWESVGSSIDRRMPRPELKNPVWWRSAVAPKHDAVRDLDSLVGGDRLAGQQVGLADWLLNFDRDPALPVAEVEEDHQSLLAVVAGVGDGPVVADRPHALDLARPQDRELAPEFREPSMERGQVGVAVVPFHLAALLGDASLLPVVNHRRARQGERRGRGRPERCGPAF